MQESLESRKHKPDLGVRLGIKLSALMWQARRRLAKVHRNNPARRSSDSRIAECQPLLESSPEPSSGFDGTASRKRRAEDEESGRARGRADRVSAKPEAADPHSLSEVLNHQTVLNLLVYALLALFTQTYDQVCLAPVSTRRDVMR